MSWYDDIYDWFTGPADDAKKELQKAADSARAAGDEAAAYTDASRARSTADFSNADAAWNAQYGPGGSLTMPGAGEKYFADSMKGENQYFNMMQKQGQMGIDNASAAGGGFNSGARLAATEKFNSDLVSSESDKMFGRANAAQGLQQGRLSGAFTSALGEGSAKSAMEMGYNGQLTQAWLTANMAAIEAEMQKAGIGLQQQKMFIDALTGLAKGGMSAAGHTS